MAKQLVWELYEVDAKDPETAMEKARSTTKRTKSVVFAASSLKALMHPAHLQESVDMFGSVGNTGTSED